MPGGLVLGLIFLQKVMERLVGTFPRVGLPDLAEVGLGFGLHALGMMVQDVGSRWKAFT